MTADSGHQAQAIPPLPGEDHTCARCGIAYPALGVDEVVRAIRAMPGDVAAAVTPVPPRLLRTRPDSTTWSPLEYVCHLRDVYATYTIRLHRARTERHPVLEPMLNDLRARRFGYNHLDPGAVLIELRHNAAGFVTEIARFTPPDWDRPVTRLPGETRTARWLARQAMHEGTHHLHDIDEVLTILRHR